MRHAYEGTLIHGVGGTAVASGGTITGSSIDWLPYYEQDLRMWVHTGATPSGTLTAAVQQSSSSSSGFADVSGGTLTTVGTTGGTAIYQVEAAVSQRYVRVNATSASGTVLASVGLFGKARNVTA